MDGLISRKEMIELEYYHFATALELRDLGIEHQQLLSSPSERQPDIAGLLMTEQAIEPRILQKLTPETTQASRSNCQLQEI